MKSLMLAFAILLMQVPQEQTASIEGIVVQLGVGTPIANARVNIGNAVSVTDSEGRFAFRNVQPGHYRVSAMHNDYVVPQSGVEITLRPGQAMTGAFVAMVPKGAISGHVYARSGDAMKDATVQALKYAYQDGRRILVPVGSTSTDQAGAYRLLRLSPGSYVVRAVYSAQSVAERNLPVYFPGTVDASTASGIETQPGVDLSGIDLTLSDAQAARVRGQVTDGVNGQPAFGAAITLVPRRGNVATGSSQRATVSKMGTFEFKDVAPGPYDIVTTLFGESVVRLAASAPVDVSASDIDNVRLVLLPQMSISGRVSMENLQGGATPLNLSGVRIELRREPYTPELLVLIPTVAVDGTFTLADVTPGEYRLKVSTGALKAYVKYARFGSINAINPPFPIGGPGEFDIVLSLNSASIDAVVVDAERKPVPAATVVLAPDPPYRQRLDLFYSTGSDPSGHVHLEGLAPGDYRMFAWDDVPADAWQDGDFIRSYEDRGKPIQLREAGITQDVELRLITTSK